MIPIDSFDPGFRLEKARHPCKGDWPHPIPAPPHPRLRRLHTPEPFGAESVWFPVMFQGYRLNWPVESRYLPAQFKTRNGYLLVGSSPSGLFSTFNVDIFYVLGDLSGAEWAEICGIEKLTAIQWIKRAALRVDWAEQPYGSPDGPEPLEETLIEDEATLLIKVRRIGWFRITLFEAERKGCRFSSRQVEHRNGGWADRRYFKVRKLLRAPPIRQPAERSCAGKP